MLDSLFLKATGPMAPAMYIMCHALKEDKFAGEEAVNSQYFGNYMATY